LAAKIKDAFGVQAELIRAAGGKFEVVADGMLVYSKLQTHEFPEEEKLIAELKNLS
jgi:selT/selW/selH-like putative selenoprotein